MFTERLQNANVLVTGGSTETGPYICRAFAEHGANVGLTYFSHPQDAESVASSVREQGREARTYALDLLDPSSIDALIAAVQSDWSRLDALILCAGSVGLRNFRNLTREQVDVAIDGNVKGNFMLAKELGYWMKEQTGGGRIIQFTAQSAENASHSAYGLAKAAQREAGAFLAYHLAPEVTVNTIQPTRIDHDPTHATGAAYASPLGRMVHARELARVCLLLCDEGFDTVTGDVLRLDSGRHVAPAYPREL